MEEILGTQARIGLRNNVPVKDSTGAGDGMAAGLLFGLLGGSSLRECADLSFLMATLVSEHVGARTGQPFGVPADNPTQFRADFPPGTHIVTVSTTWPQGDARYVFELTVLPSQPVVGGLSPEILAGIARVRETARLLAAGSAQFEQQLAAVFASADALTASLLDMVDEILGGAFTTVPSQPG